MEVEGPGWGCTTVVVVSGWCVWRLRDQDGGVTLWWWCRGVVDGGLMNQKKKDVDGVIVVRVPNCGA